MWRFLHNTSACKTFRKHSVFIRRSSTNMATTREMLVAAYHEKSKHAPRNYAPGPNAMDWKTQPNPFRKFEGCETKSLLNETQENESSYNSIYFMNNKAPSPLTSTSLSQFLFYSLSLSAWKSHGDTAWSLRVNPSSGNLHPSEGYVLLPPVSGFSTLPAVWHYTPKDHGLEQRVELPENVWKRLSENLPEGSFFVALSSIYWRESWKYGMRAFRYCQHDAGHALACLRLSASMQGWQLEVMPDVTTKDLSTLLGTSRVEDFHENEEEHPDFLAVVSPMGNHPAISYTISESVLDQVANCEWKGKANKLSSQHLHSWEAIDEVSLNSQKITKSDHGPRLWEQRRSFTIPSDLYYSMAASTLAGKIIRQRRSAQEMDGQTSITQIQFYGMLMRTVPAITQVPWDSFSFPYPTSVHLGIFVHRVDGLPPGLYVLIRDEAQVEEMKKMFHPQFVWQATPELPAGLHLYLLHQQDVTLLAQIASCQQAIAGDGAFSLGMFANMNKINEVGAHAYPILFWETGMIGQVLYLEAEAQGVRATGIGCFFDNVVHQLFELQLPYQSLYHFTIGGPVEDRRVRTMGGYESHGRY